MTKIQLGLNSMDENRHIVFDVSLLAPESHDLVEGILEENNLTFVMSKEMAQVFKGIRGLKGYLRLWEIDVRYADLIADFLERIKIFERVKVVAVEDLPKPKFVGFLEDVIREKKIVHEDFVDFLAEEMCLALNGYPIICTATSSWKIVKFFEGIGAKVKRTARARIYEKMRMLKTKKFKLAALAIGLNVAFVYVLEGPLDAINILGTGAINLVIVNG